MIDEILSYREMCDRENTQTLQRGMNYHLCPQYSLILMSRRSNAPYNDKVLDDGLTIEYEGHDVAKTGNIDNPKELDQPKYTEKGSLTQNGLFINAIELSKTKNLSPETVKVYEKVLPGVWSFKGYFDLMDYSVRNDGKRSVFVFQLKLSANNLSENDRPVELEHTRLIPSDVKKKVWQRDKGQCVICGSVNNLHFDHDLPFSKGGTSLLASNVKLLCAKCNLAKSNKIE